MMVEGLGDEVVTFFSCMVLILIGALSWWSSNVRDSHPQPTPPVAPATPAHPATDSPAPHTESSDALPPVNAADSDPLASADPPSSDEAQDQDRVSIKLKFLNDSHKEVRACLAEKLGRFKLRHFAPDLAANKRVRFI
ncbi:hypothetical protein TCAL_14174, partial [Tigriopus californicus]|eukprot:TCALIF_14174-PA protein Name:"Similar to Tmub1 Transmembrane and ubiquitin-like domain-containing protein 1 (Mus musculus)" AED:0.00 eAED:0.00 QI:0/-1/0/1/-1/1/1/0/137